MVHGMLQFFHSLSDRLTRQEKPHPHHLHIDLHWGNYMGLCHPLLRLCWRTLDTLVCRPEEGLKNMNWSPAESVHC
jgi:hypothetical protein